MIRSRQVAALCAVGTLLAACSGDDTTPPEATADTVGSSTPSDEPTTEPAEQSADEPAEEPAAEEPSDDESADEPASDGAVDEFAWRDAPTGDPILLGMVNSEGTPGLDFPEMRVYTDHAADYLNAHGGFGGRPVQIEHCATNGSPEASQACAQELAGTGVELVMLGLDLFPGYDTFTASGIPVVGALPILPGDYTANALFVTGGNLTAMAAMVALAQDGLGAQTAGIISADNPGANGSEAALGAALDKAGITYVSIKGGDNETDAGFQGLLRQATADDPDVLFNLYSDAGCIGAMRGRVSMGISTPTISTPICASAEVLDVVGDDAFGWSFVGVGASDDSAASAVLEEIADAGSPDGGASSLGLGALGITQIMTLARVANQLASEGVEPTGAAIYDRMGTSNDLTTFPNGTPLECGLVDDYRTVCSFEFPIGEYVGDGEVATIPGFESVSVVDLLP